MRTSLHHQSEAQPPNGPLTAATSPDTPSTCPASQSCLCGSCPSCQNSGDIPDSWPTALFYEDEHPASFSACDRGSLQVSRGAVEIAGEWTAAIALAAPVVGAEHGEKLSQRGRSNGIHERTLHLEAGFLRMVGTMAVYLFERRCRNCERFHANASSGQRAMIASRNVP